MVEQFPLFVSADEANRPTTIAAYVSGVDTIPESVGGTGVSAFSSTVSAMADLVASSVASAVCSSVASAVTGWSVIEGVITQDSSKKLTQLAVSGSIESNVSSLLVSSCPIPQPYGFMQTTTNGTAASTETRIGADATVGIAQSNANDISWHLTGDYFMLSAAGVYEITANMISTVAASTSFTLRINKNGTAINSANSMIHSSIDPTQTSIQTVILCAASDYIDATFEDDASTNITCNPGSSLLVKRLS